MAGFWNNLFGFRSPTYGLNYANGMRTNLKDGQVYTFGNDNWLYNNGMLTEQLADGVAGPTRQYSVGDLVGSIGTDAAGNKFTLGEMGNQGGFSLGGVLGGLAGLAQGAGGLLSAYTGMKSLEMAKDQFGFQRALANRNLANQAKIINNTYDNAATVAAAMSGHYDPGTNRSVDPSAATVKAAREEGRKRHVDGSPI